MSNPVKILIIRFSSIGDIVLTTPIIRCLKQQLPEGSEIHYLTKKRFAEILEANPYVDRLHTLQDSLPELLFSLKNERFDILVDLHKNLRSLRVRRALGAKTYSFDKLNFQKWVLVQFGIDLLPDMHIVDRYFQAVHPLGVENDGKGLDYFLPTSSTVDQEIQFPGLGSEYIAFSIGGAHAGKKLPLNKLEDVCNRISNPILLMGGPDDTAVGEVLSKGRDHVFNACGQLSVNESAFMLSKARVVISHDTGLMHIAAAFKKKIISIWGATVPKFGMYPYEPDPASMEIEARHLSFRPTSKLGNKGSSKELRTVNEIDTAEIADAAMMLWEV